MEYILLLMVVIIGIRTSYTDIKKRKIYNKDLIITTILGLAIYLIGYKQFMSTSYWINVVISLVIGILFYSFKIWAAGDAKLFSVIILLVPYELYREDNGSIFPAFYILAMIFSVAFIYVVVETIILMLKKEEILIAAKQYTRKDVVAWILNAFTGYNIILLLDELIKWKFSWFYIQNIGLMIIIHLLLLMFIYQKVKRKEVMNILLLATLVMNILVFALKGTAVGGFNVLYGVMVIIVLLLREKGSQYNYEKIPTEKVLSGMILTYGTVLKFLTSRVKGLPNYTDETTKCRITEAEAEAIRRWKASKYGEDYIVVVKHIPFAPFILIGTLLYLVLKLI